MAKKKTSVKKHVRKTKKGYVPVREHWRKIKNGVKKNFGMAKWDDEEKEERTSVMKYDFMNETEAAKRSGNKKAIDKALDSFESKVGVMRSIDLYSPEEADELIDFAEEMADKDKASVELRDFNKERASKARNNNFGNIELSEKEKKILRKVSLDQDLTPEEREIWDNPLKASKNFGNIAEDWKTMGTVEQAVNMPGDRDYFIDLLEEAKEQGFLEQEKFEDIKKETKGMTKKEVVDWFYKED